MQYMVDTHLNARVTSLVGYTVHRGIGEMLQMLADAVTHKSV